MRAIVKTLTDDCDRDDCAVECLGSSVTQIGWSQSYNRDGSPAERNPNTRRTGYRCRTCGALWDVVSRGGHDDVVTRLAATHQAAR